MSDNSSKVHAVKGVSSSTGETPHVQGADQAILLESLSALMDGHADELELRRILKAMSGNPELGAKWQRFHAVRSCLQQEMHTRPAVNLLSGINARLAAESIALPKPTNNRFANPVLRYIGQGAIAASFFVMTIMATSVFNQSGADVQPAVAETTSNLDTPVLGGEYRGSELSRTASLENTIDEEALARLSQAVHQEFSDVPATPEIPVSYTFELPINKTTNP